MKYVVSGIFILAVKLSCCAQVNISSNIGTDELVCPGSSTNYYIYLSGDASLCSATWQITNGLGNFYQDDNEGSSVDITWDDQKPNKVEVQASVDYIDPEGNCTSPENAVVTFEHVLRSVFQETIPNVGSSVNVPYCSGAQPTVTLSAGPMYIKNTGGFDEPPSTEVEAYNWDIPTGWQQKQTGETGSIFTEVGILEIEPVNPGGLCSPSGEVEVRALAGGVYNCEGTVISESLVSTIGIIRSPNPSTLTVSPPPGFIASFCGLQPVTFTATDISCATDYDWSYPGGWTEVSSSGNTITLAPGGTPNDQGSISAQANLACGTLDMQAYSVQFLTPTLNGPSVVCAENTQYTLNNIAAGTAVTWSKSAGLDYVSGQNTDHYVVKANSSFIDGGWIKATLNSCDNFEVQKDVFSDQLPAIVGLDQVSTDQSSTITFNYSNSQCNNQVINWNSSSNTYFLTTSTNYGVIQAQSWADDGETGYVYLSFQFGGGVYKEFTISSPSPPPPVVPNATYISIDHVPNDYPTAPYNSFMKVVASYSGNSNDVDYWEWQIYNS